MRRCFLLAFIALYPLLLHAEWVPDPADSLQVEAAASLVRFREAGPDMPMYFEQAYACAVFPKVTRAGFVFGGAYGRGIVIAADQLRGTVTLTSLTLGFQVGGQADSQIIFFRDAEALELFIATGNLGKLSGRVEFQGRASAVAVAAGGATTPGFSGDVALFSLTPRGLMLELAAGLVRYRFSPADENLADGQTGEGGD